MKSIRHRQRSGATLLELLMTVSISATLLASSLVVIRSSYGAWQAHRADAQQASTADLAMRHFVQTVRQAESVSYLYSNPGSYEYVGVQTPDGITHLYYVYFNSLYYFTQETPGGSWVYEFLTEDLDGGGFTCYGADGVTETTTLDDIHLIRFELDIPNSNSSTQTYSTYAWIRSW